MRLEHRLAEEKERAQKKVTQLQDEYEQRLRDEQTSHEDEINMLQEDARENDMRLTNQINQLEHECALMH